MEICEKQEMKAEIISVGSEITSGQCLDTNGQWLSLRLGEIGIQAGWHTTVADDLKDNVDAFRLAATRGRLVIITGGLGPTLDDLTREALANAAGVELVFHPESFEKIRKMFARRRRTMPERNRVQAMFPLGAEPIPNDRGTAPGIFMRLGSAIIVAMPGVPSEMFAMYDHWVRPRLLELGLGGGVQIQRKINCFGTGESHIEEKLADLTQRGRVPEVGITASDATISLRILARAPSLEAAQEQIAPVERAIRERLGQLVFGVDDQELQDVVVELLNATGLTLAAAEDVTGGLVAQRVSGIAASERCFRGALVAMDDRVKTAILGVPAEVIREHGTVSPQVAEAMAAGGRKLFGTDLALSTVGIIRADVATAEKPIGTTWVGLAWEGGVSSLQFGWVGTPREIQSRGAKMALNQVRLRMLV
jgi:nicotinamide-nucleotide amidase